MSKPETEKQASNRWLTIGCFSTGLAVLIGAFGAHGLADHVTHNRLTTFETGVRYHFYHSIAILVIGILVLLKPQAFKFLQRIACLFLLGTILFSGSLYALVLLDIAKLGMITPIGGMSWIIAWIWLGLTARQF